MILYPKYYVKNITMITNEFLKENKIQGLILDVDNTLIDYYKNFLEGVEQWCKEKKEAGFKLCIVSNSNKKEKVELVAQKLDIPYLYFAKKPLKTGFQKAKKILNLPENKIAVIGDQIFTDVLGANRSNMFSILVDPIEEKDIFITLMKRPIENWIKKKYQTKSEETKRR